ncbi:hypothetical protein K435DRAFT_278619 [Dendrothele bispora CBS 962.96]|uniref:Uncharacterized protein n=1 Tax=Dendrothele bispora (strain CBS 962.96) TaxID=1314807 RepID=A0A4S8ML69_DENBC|nr:hypothetical protein K435DRAFT_278619 [Dendrothele bispora CBS 962.96]
MTILDGFKIKPLDLEPIYDSWPNAPKFVGNPKKDPPVDDWLRQIRAGCVQRNVPREYWHKVAQHYLGDRAKARYVVQRNLCSRLWELTVQCDIDSPN